MRWLGVVFVLAAVSWSGVAQAAHIAYRPLEIGLEGEDVFELQLTLGFFGQTLGPADGILDAGTFRALLEFFQLEPGTKKVGGEHLEDLYWFYLARNWPQDAFLVPIEPSWGDIANTFGVPVAVLRMVNQDQLVAGERLLIPVEYNVHQVLEGETLCEIAERYHVAPSLLGDWNQLEETGELPAGRQLLIVMDYNLNDAEEAVDSLLPADVGRRKPSYLGGIALGLFCAVLHWPKNRG